MLEAVVAVIILASILSIVAITQKQKGSSLFKFFKPLPIIILAMMVVQISLGYQFTGIQIFIIVGLIFGLAGDIFLANEARFMLQGLGSFLVGHIMYIVAFYKGEIFVPHYMIAAVCLYSLFFGGTLVFMLGNTQNKKMRIPVIVYLLTITLMLLVSMNYDYATAGGVSYLTLGAALFIVSDTILGFDMLIKKIGGWEVFVLIFYYSAQIIIAFKAVSYYL